MAKRSTKLPVGDHKSEDFAENSNVCRESSVLDLSEVMKSPPQNCCVRDLKDCLGCLEEIALWHHHEWLRTSDESIDVTTFGQKLDQRIELLKNHTDQPGIPFTLVAEAAGKIAGTVSVVQYRFARSQLPSEWLTNLFVLPEYREQKIGSYLLQCAETLAGVHGVKTLKLYTYDQAEFYKRRQWQVMGDARIQRREVTILSKDIS